MSINQPVDTLSFDESSQDDAGFQSFCLTDFHGAKMMVDLKNIRSHTALRIRLTDFSPKHGEYHGGKP